jgi:hypothetical protein
LVQGVGPEFKPQYCKKKKKRKEKKEKSSFACSSLSKKHWLAPVTLRLFFFKLFFSF